nr:hypothetical protein [uncultured Carboxylicivirga sp.]
MLQPTIEQIYLIKTIIDNSLDSLILNDSEIFDIHMHEPRRISEDARVLNRELHETTINHRLAYYLENNIQKCELSYYKVDIEYNRFYENLKLLDTVEGIRSVRPDILIHSRTNHEINPQHYLVIEAKKGTIIQHDINKINGFISDENYNYLFGLTVSYCSSDSHILANLYYFDGEDIINEQINREK